MSESFKDNLWQQLLALPNITAKQLSDDQRSQLKSVLGWVPKEEPTAASKLGEAPKAFNKAQAASNQAMAKRSDCVKAISDHKTALAKLEKESPELDTAYKAAPAATTQAQLVLDKLSEEAGQGTAPMDIDKKTDEQAVATGKGFLTALLAFTAQDNDVQDSGQELLDALSVIIDPNSPQVGAEKAKGINALAESLLAKCGS